MILLEDMATRHEGEIVDLANFPELILPQLEMNHASQHARANGIRKGYISSATGTGKTYAEANDVKHFIEEEGHHEAEVLYLCHDNGILDQARETFEDVHPYSSFGNIRGGVCEKDNQFTFATFASMLAIDNATGQPRYKSFDPKKYKYITVDEAHHGPAETYSEVIKYFEPAFLKGLTATPLREDKKPLEELFGNKLYDYQLEEAIADGVLAHPDYRLYTEQHKSLNNLIRQVGSLTLKDIKAQIEIIKKTPEAKLEVARTIIEAQSEVDDPRTILFCNTITETEEYQKLIPGSLALHSKLTPEEQKERLEWYREGLIPTLVVVDKLNEGIDVPETNILAFARGTESKRIWLQQLGRGLRNFPGKKNVIVLDFAASWERINLVADLKNKVEDIFKGKRTKKARKHNLNIDKRTGPEPAQEIPFSFSFSRDALDAISVVERMRKNGHVRKSKRAPGVRKEMWDKNDATVMEMMSLTKLPEQKITDREWERFGQRFAKNDPTAREELVTRRLRSVMRRARITFDSLPAGASLTLEDCFQNHLRSFIEAVDSYDPSGRKSLKNHLSWGEFNNRHVMNTQHLVRVPIHIQDRLSKYHESDNTDDELVEHAEKVNNIDNWQSLESIEDQVGDKSHDIIEHASHTEAQQTIKQALTYMSYREKRVIELRFGLNPGEGPVPNEDIAHRFNVTRVRAGQIEKFSLKKFALLDQARKLQDLSTPDESGDNLGRLPLGAYHKRRIIAPLNSRIKALMKENREIRVSDKSVPSYDSGKAVWHVYDPIKRELHEKNRQEIEELDKLVERFKPHEEIERHKYQQQQAEKAKRRRELTMRAVKNGDFESLERYGYNSHKIQSVVNESVAEYKQHRLTIPIEDYIYSRIIQKTIELQA